MSALAAATTDTATMLRRRLRHLIRYPSLTISLIGIPVVFLLLFVYVFGATLGAGLGGASGGRAEYADYLTPGIVIFAVCAAAQGTAISVAMDMASGIMARFRTMAIARSSVLTGHVLGSTVQTLLGQVVVLGAAVAVGARPTAGPADWLAAAGLVVLVTLALTWLSVALGLASRSVESASNAPQALILLPFLSSGFVPIDSLPGWMRWFAEHQPFTPVIEALRHLLYGGPLGSELVVAGAWCVAVTLAAWAWARALYARRPVR
jgi:ABC-2 type transport system permease protein